LGCYRIPTPRLKLVANATEAASAAGEFAAPVVLKIASPDILHKSDVGGVALNLETADMVRQAAEAMMQRVRMTAPKAKVRGFVVQEMIKKPRAHELIAGMAVDRQFGPFLLFGQGGTAVEVINDKALALPPLNLTLARELMSQTRIFRQLQGYRDQPAAALDDIAMMLVRLSQLVADLDEVVEIDINPLLVDDKGAIALDARVRVAKGQPARRGGRLAIMPYPRELERAVSVAGFESATLRPIRPEDATALADLLARVTPEDSRLRFFVPLPRLEPRQLARMTQIDYDREMAFIATRQDQGGEETLAVVRAVADPDRTQAEFAILVRSDLKGRGLGALLMRKLIRYCRERGIGELVGDVLASNARMLALARDLGCGIESGADATVKRVRLPLSRAQPEALRASAS
jgi:acetyltransferase